MDTKAFGRNVLISRRDLNMTQKELADRIGISQSYITKIERGRAKNMSVELVFDLATALSVNPAWLLGLSQDPLGVETDLENEQYVVIDVEDSSQRRLVQEVLDAFVAMSPVNQRLVTSIMRMIRQAEEDQRLTSQPIE